MIAKESTSIRHHSTLRRWSDDLPAKSRIRGECSASTSCRWNRDLLANVGLTITRNIQWSSKRKSLRPPIKVGGAVVCGCVSFVSHQAIRPPTQGRWCVSIVAHRTQSVCIGGKLAQATIGCNSKLLTPQPQAHEMKATTVSKTVKPLNSVEIKTSLICLIRRY